MGAIGSGIGGRRSTGQPKRSELSFAPSIAGRGGTKFVGTPKLSAVLRRLPMLS
jgi:hypothetical protein